MLVIAKDGLAMIDWVEFKNNTTFKFKDKQWFFSKGKTIHSGKKIIFNL